MSIEINICGSIHEIPESQWNALIGTDSPFLKHQYLSALENHHAVGEKFGWYPQYVTAWFTDKHESRLLGAIPMYLKDNSYGEFVFDWAWADAYHRAGINYYPKLVIATPYNPVSGFRILLLPTPTETYSSQQLSKTLIEAVKSHAQHLKVSSIHCLFSDDVDTKQFLQQDFMSRLGCQFHWTNNQYRDFADYLQTFNSKNRKKIKRERRRMQEQNISFELLSGNEISEQQWNTYHYFYASTFDKKGGLATLSLDFFKQIGQTMPDNLLLILAKQGDKYVAAAFNLLDQHTLYGRHWGCSEEFHSLHFEACYYQGLDFCIKHRLKHFEPGAQGEHKISRGFLPTKTWSTHWIANDQFRVIVKEFLQRETIGMEQYINSLQQHSPYK